ncbi:MAG: hypothetical protein OEW08_02830 [Gammaproteobacteria bacterium]|nr:hypothetical protein [Gammaproteobacteria bacterium]
MADRGNSREKEMRNRIALEAARIMVEDGIKDFYLAKRKAVQHLNVPDSHVLPRNTEIEQAIVDYQRLFKSQSQPRRLRQLRAAAIEALQFFSRFQARLVGSVVNGTATEHSDVNLHLFCDSVEEVGLFLLSNNIPYDTGERRYRSAGGETRRYIAYRFVAGDVPVELVVFPVQGMREAPLSEVDGKPLRRVNLAAARALLEGGEESPQILAVRRS